MPFKMSVELGSLAALISGDVFAGERSSNARGTTGEWSVKVDEEVVEALGECERREKDVQRGVGSTGRSIGWVAGAWDIT